MSDDLPWRCEERYATDEHGRFFARQYFGEQHEDAAPRLHCQYHVLRSSQPNCWITTAVLLTYAKVLRIIGVPELRYREDPVRMLRVVRCRQTTIYDRCRHPQTNLGNGTFNQQRTKRARVFDEMLKLLTSGHAMACLQQLRKEACIMV